MPFELRHRKHIEDELTKIVRQELRITAHALTTSEGSRLRSVVHESRKSVKKTRAVAAFLTQAGARLPRRDRRRLKSAARALSSVRDSAAMIDTFDRVHRRYPKQLPEHTYGILRHSLLAARDRSEACAERDGVVADAIQNLEKARKAAKKWTSPSIKRSDMIAILAASYRRSRQAMKRARQTEQSVALHRWRKEVKTLWYELRLARPLMPGIASFIAELTRLETELGDDHNLVVLVATLRRCPDLGWMGAEVRKIARLAARMRQSLRRRAFALGRRLHARKPEAFARWLRALFKQSGPQQAAA